MFEILAFQKAHVASVTNRIERHGDEEKPAVSIGLEKGGAGPQEAPPQSATTEIVIERSQPGTRTARGREKTKAALAAGDAS